VRIVLGCDHAGLELKRVLAAELSRLGHDILDLGVHDETPSDYPDIAEAVGLAVVGGRGERGLVLCGSGVGASVAANKLPGIRAGLCHDTYSAHQGVEHDDVNVLVLGARVIGTELAAEILRTFLAATFTGETRHLRRLAKIRDLERRFATRLTTQTGETT